MSCDAVAFSAWLWLAAASPAAVPATQEPVLAAPTSVASEPLFAEIIRRAGALRSLVAALRLAPEGTPQPGFADLQKGVDDLSALDMQGHLTLKARGTDGDLKCILRGISQDLPLKLKDVMTASGGKPRELALRDLDYLLRDNVEVITAPPAPAV